MRSLHARCSWKSNIPVAYSISLLPCVTIPEADPMIFVSPAHFFFSHSAFSFRVAAVLINGRVKSYFSRCVRFFDMMHGAAFRSQFYLVLNNLALTKLVLIILINAQLYENMLLPHYMANYVNLLPPVVAAARASISAAAATGVAVYENHMLGTAEFKHVDTYVQKCLMQKISTARRRRCTWAMKPMAAERLVWYSCYAWAPRRSASTTVHMTLQGTRIQLNLSR